MSARRYVGAAYFALCFAQPSAAAPPGGLDVPPTSNTVRFTPVIRLYECPPNFVYRSDCNVKERVLEPQKLELNIQVLTERMGQWSLDATSPIAASYFVIVARGPVAGHFNYSVSAETGLKGSPAPFANARVEFPDGAIPQSFGVSSATMEKDGKKYLTEIRITGFQGNVQKRK